MPMSYNSWVAESLDFDKDYDASVFETTIRLHYKVYLYYSIYSSPRLSLFLADIWLKRPMLSGYTIIMIRIENITTARLSNFSFYFVCLYSGLLEVCLVHTIYLVIKYFLIRLKILQIDYYLLGIQHLASPIIE
jgi:hypothetical protein